MFDLFNFYSEMGHATACWLTGGKVEGIEVHGDEGGVTKYVGGWRWFIIPAGIAHCSHLDRCMLIHLQNKLAEQRSLLCANLYSTYS